LALLVPPYAYALISALLWAISVPILNIGLRRLPQQAVHAVVPGLLVSMTAGTLVLGVIAYPLNGMQAVSTSTILAGVFTYPVATGLYYAASFAFGARTEFAAQFAKIKPLFSTLIAVTILGETVGSVQMLPLALMAVGIALFYLGLSRRLYNRIAVTLGLLTALAWAVGEAMVKVAFVSGNNVDHAFVALAAGTLIAWLFYPLARALGLRPACLEIRWLWPFAVHGILSFGVAYTLFFHSIATLGLYSTVLINAFWPFLSMLGVKWIQGMTVRHGEQRIPLTVWLASGLLLVASLIEILLLNAGHAG
jgi:drug/metabolite transporter (DMT)-like permease